MLKYFTFLGIFLVSVSLLIADTSEETILSWIKKLGSDDFQSREEAMSELKKIGEPALPLLREAENHPDPEISWRSKNIVEHIISNFSKEEKKDDSVTTDDNSMPFNEEFEYNGPGFRFKFKFSGKLNDIFGEEFSKLKKEFFQDEAFRHFPKNFEQNFDSIQEEIEKLLSDEQFPIFPKKEIEKMERQWQDIQEKVLPTHKFTDGVKLDNVDEVIQVQLGLKKEQGLIVSDISTGILVDKGVEKWDLLLSINKVEITSVKQFNATWKKIMPGDKVTFDIIRKGKAQLLEFIK